MISPLKTGVFLVFSVCIIGIFALALLMERPVPAQGEQFLSNQPVQYVQKSTFSTSKDLQAVVKGSIYETGSNMTVFGACENAKGYLLPGSVAKFTAWYPNGTVMMGPNISMTSVLNGTGGPTGRFLIHVTMPDVIGTYFTEMRCEYGNDYALAFGEWQNPEWVRKIGDTYVLALGMNGSITTIGQQIQNLSVQLGDFQQEVGENFTTVVNLLGSLNASVASQNHTAIDEKLKEIYNMGKATQHAAWVMDAENPVYSLGSGQYGWRAVDMLGKNAVYVAGVDGNYASWDGQQWSFGNISNVTWFGVSMLPAIVPYGWLLGRTGPDFAQVELWFNSSAYRPVWSQNGGPPQTINEAWFNATIASAFVDGKLFLKPNDPGAPFSVYLLTDTGHVALSEDNGVTWVNALVESGVPEVSAGGRGRISEIISNLDQGVTEGYRVAIVNEGGAFIYYNGTNYTAQVTQNVSYRDVALVYDNLAYVVGRNLTTGNMVVWRFDGGALTSVYEAASTTPAGIAASARDDVWVATSNPSVYYHFDGFRWSYQAFPFSENGLVTVWFFTNESANWTLPVGLQDIVMSDALAGYAVGEDGLIMKYYDWWDVRFDQVMTQLQNLTVDINVTKIEDAIANLTNITLAMNASFSQQMTAINGQLVQMNTTLNLIENQSQQILSNVTYTQQYLETTVTPSLNSILAMLGLINETIRLQNETLQIVNRTEQKVDVLVDQANRPRAWTTV